ncbi:MAG: 50S ribosomal protein L22 [Nanoarchaeota archaeon]|nr:50S ribosomal protein L22 [Nanoarchaeota archaeon]
MEYKINAKDLGISSKTSVEVCRLLRNKTVKKAQQILQRVLKKKQPVPYKRYKKEIPHRAGKIATGRYPIKISKEILKLLKGGLASAQNQGLSQDLIISHISAHKASHQWHSGRKRRRRMKRTHIKIILKETKNKNDRKTDSK